MVDFSFFVFPPFTNSVSYGNEGTTDDALYPQVAPAQPQQAYSAPPPQQAYGASAPQQAYGAPHPQQQFYPPAEPQAQPVYYDQAPPPALVGVPILAPQPYRSFRYGICDFFDECGLCCKAYWCPCIVVGENSQLRGEADNTGEACCCILLAGAVDAFIPLAGNAIWGLYAGPQRRRTRHMLGIHGDDCEDCLWQAFCISCALTQEQRELRDAAQLQQLQAPPPQQYMR